MVVGLPDDEPDGLGPEFRSFLVPRRDFTVDQECWHVTGLAGTGSKDVHVADAFVPEYSTRLVLTWRDLARRFPMCRVPDAGTTPHMRWRIARMRSIVCLR